MYGEFFTRCGYSVFYFSSLLPRASILFALPPFYSVFEVMFKICVILLLVLARDRLSPRRMRDLLIPSSSSLSGSGFPRRLLIQYGVY